MGDKKRHKFSTVSEESFSPCRCYNYVTKRRNNRYTVMGTSLNININKKSTSHHIMVKVGGGWQTLEDYLERHAPYKFSVIEYKRLLHGEASEIKDMYLGMRSRYKSTERSKLCHYSLF